MNPPLSTPPAPRREPRRVRRGFPLLLTCVASFHLACGGAIGVIGDGPPPTPELFERYEERRLALLDDYEPWIGPGEVRLRALGNATASAPAEVGWCYAYFAVGETRLIDLDLVVTRPNGRVVGSDEMFDNYPFVQYCADWNEEVSVELRASRGSGRAAVGVLRKPD